MLKPRSRPKKNSGPRATFSLHSSHEGDDSYFPDFRELLRPSRVPLSEVRHKACYKGFHSSYVREIVVFEDCSELYRYNDNHEFVLRHLRGYMINGKLLTAREWNNRELIITYEDENGEVLRLDLPEDPGESNEAVEKIESARKDITARIKNYPLEDDLKGDYATLEQLSLEERSINARRSVCDELFTLHFAQKPLNSLFTIRASRSKRAKPQAVKGKSVAMDRKGRTSESNRTVLARIIDLHYPHLQKFQTVPGSIRVKLIELLKQKGSIVSPAQLRTYLFRLDYTKTRGKPQ